MSQGSRFGRLLALVVLLAGLVGCAPVPIGSDSNSKANAMMGERLSSSSQNVPSPAERRVASSQNPPLPPAASSFESTASSRTESTASSRPVPSPATDSPTIESPPTTRFALSRDSANVSDDATDYIITSQDILQVTIFQVPDLARTVRVDGSGFVS